MHLSFLEGLIKIHHPLRLRHRASGEDNLFDLPGDGGKSKPPIPLSAGEDAFAGPANEE